MMKDEHPTTINYLTTYKTESKDELYFTTMCSSGVLKLWVGSYSEDGKVNFNLKSELLFGRNLQEVTELKRIGANDMLLLTGGYDSKIHVYMTSTGVAASELKF